MYIVIGIIGSGTISLQSQDFCCYR